jgi:hypothetical protein
MQRLYKIDLVKVATTAVSEFRKLKFFMLVNKLIK